MLTVRQWVEWSVQGIEVLAVTVVVASILLGTVRWLVQLRKEVEAGYAKYRLTVGRSLLLGLELLVAADVIRTVALETTLVNLAALGLLVIIRTALGWTLTLEVEGRWPWQAAKGAGSGSRHPPV